MRNTKENLEIEKRNRNNDLLNGEKRMKDLQDIETRYSNEISQLRKQKEDLMSQLNDTFNSEKEGLRAKLSDLEKRAKEAE